MFKTYEVKYEDGYKNRVIGNKDNLVDSMGENTKEHGTVLEIYEIVDYNRYTGEKRNRLDI